MSKYCTVKAKDAFKDLVENLDVKYLAVSYNNTYKSKSKSSKNKIEYEEIIEILNGVGKTKIFEQSYQYFNAGKTNFNNHKEFLFPTKNMTKHKKTYRSPLFYVGDKYKLYPKISKPLY